MNRRRFLEGIGTVGLVGLGGSRALAAASRGKGAADPTNPFAYDIERLRRVDPALIRYRELRRFASPKGEACRLAIGPDGRIYIAAGKAVCITDADGNAQRAIELAGPARGLHAAEDGTLFVSVQDHIEVFNAAGKPTATWESPGKKAWITSIVATETDVFAADSGNRILLRYDRSGKLVRRLGARDRERNIPGFVIPSPWFDVEMHRDGLLRVTNPGRHRVELYTTDGDFEGAWGRASAAIDGFCGCCNPINIALMSDGRFITCEKGVPRVKVYSRDGEFESVVAAPDSFGEATGASGADLWQCTVGGLDAAVDSRERIYVLNLAKAEVHVFQLKPAGVSGA